MGIPAGPAPTSSPSLPDWAPDAPRVATYIPERSILINDAAGIPVLTFTADTRPTAEQIASQIEDAVFGWLLPATGELHESLEPAGTAVAAIRAAGMAEVSWPVRDADLSAAQLLLTQADVMLKQLAARNVTLTGTDPDDPDAVFEIAPVWSFPESPSWGDELL